MHKQIITMSKKSTHKKYLKTFTGRLILTALAAVLQIVAFLIFTAALSDYSIPISMGMTALSAVVVLFIINTDKNPAYKLLWSIVILTFPIFGGIMFLTAKLQSSTYLFKKRAEKAERLTLPHMRQDPAITAAMRAESRTKANHAAYLAEKAHFPVHKNTEVVYFPSGEAKFERLRAELLAARKFIFLEYFIIQEGFMWDSILKILIAKVREGVEVRLIWDGMGSYSTLPKHYDKTLESLGIHTLIFNPFVPVATVTQNNRDHRKIVVIDGHTAFTGGVNLADEYINVIERYGHWKDAAVMLRGDAARSFTLMFLTHWYMGKPADADITAFFHKPAPGEFLISDARTSGCVQPYADTPLDGECVGELVYFNLINKAKDYIYIMTPYLIPDNELVTALCFAAKSGIDVRIITPHIPDKKSVFEVTRSFYGVLLASGVKIYEYTPGFLHSKVVVADDAIGVCGSVNFDYRSLYLHFECAAYLYRVEALREIRRDFFETMAVSQEITMKDVKQQGFFTRLGAMLLKAAAPLM